MTTIAYRDGVMCGDGRATYGKIIVDENARKVFRLKSGRVVGIAGRLRDITAVRDALNEYPDDPMPDVKFKRSDILVSDGEFIYSYTNGWEPKMSRPFYAIGDGMYLAMAAMEAGATAREAVEIASKMSLYTGGVITTVRVR